MALNEFPQELKDARNWVLAGGVKGTKDYKVNYTRSDISTHMTQNELLKVINRDKLACFMFKDQDFYFGVDVDDPSDHKAERDADINKKILVLAEQHGLFITQSMSGKGYHIYGRLSPFQKAFYQNANGDYELFVNGNKYFCESGNIYHNVESIPNGFNFLQELESLCPNTDIKVKKKATKKPAQQTQPTEVKQDQQAETQNSDFDYLGKIEKISNLDTKTIINEINSHEPNFLTPAKNKGYICPFCGNGSGPNGTGIVQDKKRADKVMFTCFGKCNGKERSTFDYFIGNKGYYNTATLDLTELKPIFYIDLVKECANYFHIPLYEKTNFPQQASTVQPTTEKGQEPAGITPTSDQEKINYILLKVLKWKFEKNKPPELLKTRDNVLKILLNDPFIARLDIHYNIFSYEISKKIVNWNNYNIGNKYEIWSDTDDAGLCLYLERTYHFKPTTETVNGGFLVYLQQKQKHPIREYLESLPKWDGIERVPTLLVDYMGAKDTLLNREIAKLFTSASIQRVYNAGVKYDYIVILNGKQGIGKSTFINKLYGKYYLDFGSNLDKFTETIRGFWGIELSELASFNKKDANEIKSIITRQKDTFREPYAKRTESRPRQCVLFGTINNNIFLSDPTGNRRFLCVDCMESEPTKNIFKDLDNELPQIWAEAMERYKQYPLYLSKEAESTAQEIQEHHTQQHPYRAEIEKYCNNFLVQSDFENLTIDARKDHIKNYNFDYILADIGMGNLNKYHSIDMIFPKVIWCEVMGQNDKIMKNKDVREICEVLDSLPYLKRINKAKRIPFNGYGGTVMHYYYQLMDIKYPTVDQANQPAQDLNNSDDELTEIDPFDDAEL